MKCTDLIFFCLHIISCRPAEFTSNSPNITNQSPTVNQNLITNQETSAQTTPEQSNISKIQVFGTSSAWWKNCMSVILNNDISTRVSIGCNTQSNIRSEISLKGYNPNICNVMTVILDVDSSQADCGGGSCKKNEDKLIEEGKSSWSRITSAAIDKRVFKIFSALKKDWIYDKEFVISPQIKSFFNNIQIATQNLEENESFFIVAAEDQPRAVITQWDDLPQDKRTKEMANTLGLTWNDFIVGIKGKGLSIENVNGGCK